MASLPKPLIALLVATVAVFALWTAVLKKTVTGGSSSSSPSSPNAPVYQSAIAKAHQAATTSKAASAADGAPVSSAPAPVSTTPNRVASQSAATSATATTATTTAHSATRAIPAATRAPSRATPVKAVLRALSEHKVVLLLFYNPLAADDTAVEHELAGVSTHRGEVAKFAVPVAQLSHYQAVVSRVPVTTSPTLLVIDERGQARSLVGFTDQLDISQSVADALTSK